MRKVYHSDEERQEARRTYDRNRTQPYERTERRRNPRNNPRPTPTREGYRICNDCGEKPLIEFHAKNGKPLAVCIECERARDRERNALRRIRKPPKAPRECRSASPEEKAAKKVYNDAYREANLEELQALDRARHNTDEYRAYQRARYAIKSEPQRIQKALEKLNAPLPPPKTSKLCPACNPPIPKLVSEFGRCKGKKDKLAPYCKECTSKKAHARLEKRREYEEQRSLDPDHTASVRSYHTDWRHRNQLAWQGYQLQRLARKKGASVIEKVNFADILAWHGKHCYICDKPILSHHTLTFDHIVPLVPRPGEPAGTHTSDNILPAHQECNARKSNRPLEDLTDFDKRGVDY